MLERGFQYFLPHVRLESIGAAESHSPVVRYEKSSDGGVHLDWLGMRYALEARHKLSENERRLLKSVSRVLSARYRFLFNRDLAS